MKIVYRLCAVVLFFMFFSFALKNTQEIDLHFLFGYGLSGPLVLMLLGFFVLGAIFGVLALVPTVFRYRRELTQCKKALAIAQSMQAAPSMSAPDYGDGI